MKLSTTQAFVIEEFVSKLGIPAVSFLSAYGLTKMIRGDKNGWTLRKIITRKAEPDLVATLILAALMYGIQIPLNEAFSKHFTDKLLDRLHDELVHGCKSKTEQAAIQE